MSESELKSINCTSCGSPLPALAGHRAKAMVCSYCGAVMDRHDDYKVLAQYRDMKRPAGPFRIGMSGEILGVEQQVVGIVGVQSLIEGEYYRWTNYQLYSPTHGYSWLTWNDGHLTHSRRVRDKTDLPDRGFLWKAEFSAAGRAFKMYEAYDARISYIEGELTWVPKLGDSAGVIEGVDPPYGFAMSRTGDELEYELQTYLDREETLASFGIADDGSLPPKGGVHGIQPFEPGEVHSSLAGAAKYFFPVAALGALAAMFFGGGSKVAEATLADPLKGAEIVFEAPSASRLMEIELRSPLSNEWAWYDMALTHEDGETMVFGNGLQYYHGWEGGESWSEGSQTAELRFKPPKSGTYTLSIAQASDSPAAKPLSVEVKKNVFVSRWLWILAGITGLIVASLWIRGALFESARWGGGEEDDE